MKKLTFSLLLYLVSITLCKAQTSISSRPEIGKPFRDFVLDSVDNYSKKTLSYNDFKGRWVILDFWGENCSGCIASFPKINKLQKEFSKDIQFVLVTQTYQNAYQNPNTAISLFKKLQSKFDLTIPASFDQNFVNRVGPAGLPTIIIINPKGIVEAITYKISENDVNDYLAGRKPNLPRNYLLSEKRANANFNRDIPLLLYDNGGDQNCYLIRSMLAKWEPTMLGRELVIDRGKLELYQSDLKRLFRLAYIGADSWGTDTFYYGKYYIDPVLEVKDSSLFEADYNINKNIFTYSLTCPKDTNKTGKAMHGTMVLSPRVMRILQHNLEDYFQFTAHIETRVVPCYKLVATEEGKAKLKTKGGPTTFEPAKKGLKGTNLRASIIVAKIYSSSGYPEHTMPIFDETGMHDNIDINIDAIYFEDWLKEIRKLGLDLVPGKKEMKVLVITDAIW